MGRSLNRAGGRWNMAVTKIGRSGLDWGARSAAQGQAVSKPPSQARSPSWINVNLYGSMMVQVQVVPLYLLGLTLRQGDKYPPYLKETTSILKVHSPMRQYLCGPCCIPQGNFGCWKSYSTFLTAETDTMCVLLAQALLKFGPPESPME